MWGVGCHFGFGCARGGGRRCKPGKWVEVVLPSFLFSFLSVRVDVDNVENVCVG